MSWTHLHILHLNDANLRWATLEGGSRHPKLKESAAIDGPPKESLEKWIAGRDVQADRIVIYDSRPMYFSLTTQVPKRAKKQLAPIVRLKIKQEIGLPEEEIYWSTRFQPSEEGGDLEELVILVARRESLSEIADWQSRHLLAHLWVGADVEAIRSLTGHGLLPEPVLIMNADRDGATLYYAQSGNAILKGRAHTPETHGDSDLPHLGWGAATARADFGGSDLPRFQKGYAALRSLPEAPELDFTKNGWGDKLSPVLVRGLDRFDAVVLGGVIQHIGEARPMESLLRPIEAVKVEPKVAKTLQLRWILPLALLSMILLGVSVWSLRTQREEARLKLVKRANSLTAATERFRSQDSVLKRIQTDRSPLLPIFEAIHKAAPPGVNLQSLNIGETGAVQIAGTVRGQEAATTFFKSLSESKLLERVQLPEVKQDRRQQDGSGTTFRITAQVKGRGVRSKAK